jgi:hypothetical protein
MSFQNFGHQACDGTADSCNLLKDLAAVHVLTSLDEALEPIGLALDAAHPRQQALLSFDGVRHSVRLGRVLG